MKMIDSIQKFCIEYETEIIGIIALVVVFLLFFGII